MDLFHGISSLSGISPNINVAMERAGSVEAKIMPINEIVARITNNIQEKLDLNTMISVNLNFGSISRN